MTISAEEIFDRTGEMDHSSRGDTINPMNTVLNDFISFVTKAESIIHPLGVSATKPKLTENFISFITKAKTFVANPIADKAVSVSFQQFIDLAMPQIFSDIQQLLPQIAERANLVSRWLIKDDLLAVAGCRFIEDAYTELMAWALRPKTHPPSAHQRQSAWLSSLGLHSAIGAYAPCDPQTQVHTDDGIPDLVLRFEHATVCVEAKTGSSEHLTPSGVEMQTKGYPEALRQAFGLEHVPQMVFITPDGRKAANEAAICTTYVDFVLSLASALESHDLPPDTRMAFSMFFTHMLTCATSVEIDLQQMIHQIQGWSAEQDWRDHRKINQRWGPLLKAIEFFKPEQKQ